MMERPKKGEGKEDNSRILTLVNSHVLGSGKAGENWTGKNLKAISCCPRFC